MNYIYYSLKYAQQNRFYQTIKNEKYFIHYMEISIKNESQRFLEFFTPFISPVRFKPVAVPFHSDVEDKVIFKFGFLDMLSDSLSASFVEIAKAGIFLTPSSYLRVPVLGKSSDTGESERVITASAPF